ncbi:alpha-protein kinase 1-like [Patiria miniata]|uniref:Alpha-type protein kinase domain-containing protein n=1 Tax=Patiria miniata TaxID=46514 RepID=A0A914AFQ4_PATMI|nr:alpha-protein kinase 1-like [Patiria miniata]
MGSNQSNTSEVIGMTSTWVTFENNWFDEGASRYAYKGTFHGDPRLEGKPCVTKVYKEEWYERLSEYAWEADDRAYCKAQEMAQLFNIRYNTSKPIEFVRPEFTKVETRAAFKFLGFIPFERYVKGKRPGTSDSVSNIIPAHATVAVESYLEGDYVKFNSNFGYLGRADIATPAAFSHFTYHESEGKVLVCDLQGVRSSSRYMFTDPAVNSSSTKLGLYGSTDLGKAGIVKFFLKHRCNELCKGLKKPQISNMSTGERDILEKIVHSIPPSCATMHTFQVTLSSGVSTMEFNSMQNSLELKAIPEEPVKPIQKPVKHNKEPAHQQLRTYSLLLLLAFFVYYIMCRISEM